MLRVRAGVQRYQWGSTDFIPALLGVPNPKQEPFAELWMGTHPDLPAQVELQDDLVPLNELIEQAPETVVGPGAAENFGQRLPYLFKVLSAAAPLSIQAHPTKSQAEAGFARENAAGITVSAPDRNYRDDNHKPEILAALTEFYALRGFRPLEEIARLPIDVPEFEPLMRDYQATPSSLKNLYGRFMSLAQEEVDCLLSPLIERLAAADREQPFRPEQREYWVLQADREFSQAGHRDRGLFSIFLLNLIRLEPGEAVYLSAGVLHAYLRGSGVELMANSNNVLRGGLTHKHVDVPELLANIVFEGERAEVVRPVSKPESAESVFETPAAEFELRRVTLSAGTTYRRGPDHDADMIIVTDTAESSRVMLAATNKIFRLRKGNIVFAPRGVDYRVNASAPATLFLATVPRTGN